MSLSVGVDIEPLRRLKWHWAPPPDAFSVHCQTSRSHHNRLPLQPHSSVILWFYYSIFKPVEWECFWAPCSHRWWWEDSQEYVACSKCPFHYVITPFTFHMNRDHVILQTDLKKQTVIKGSPASAHIHVRSREGEILPSSIHLRLRAPNKTGMGYDRARSPLCIGSTYWGHSRRESRRNSPNDKITEDVCVPDVLKIHRTDKSFVRHPSWD